MNDEVDRMLDKASRPDAALRPAVGYLRRSTDRQGPWTAAKSAFICASVSTRTDFSVGTGR